MHRTYLIRSHDTLGRSHWYKWLKTRCSSNTVHMLLLPVVKSTVFYTVCLHFGLFVEVLLLKKLFYRLPWLNVLCQSTTQTLKCFVYWQACILLYKVTIVCVCIYTVLYHRNAMESSD